MIIKLNKGKIDIKPMAVPELLNNLYIQYIFEPDTEHLTPRIQINKNVFIGDRIYIDISSRPLSDKILIKVELLDSKQNVIRTYRGFLACNKYCIIGAKPIRPDIEDYLHKLEQQIEQLNNRIKELEELGEVI
jgi:hypothetical protein